jgi:hypothetical protein
MCFELSSGYYSLLSGNSVKVVDYNLRLAEPVQCTQVIKLNCFIKL